VGWHGVSQAMILDFTLSKQIPRYSDPALNAANPIRNEELLEGLAQMRQDREARRLLRSSQYGSRRTRFPETG